AGRGRALVGRSRSRDRDRRRNGGGDLSREPSRIARSDSSASGRMIPTPAADLPPRPWGGAAVALDSVRPHTGPARPTILGVAIGAMVVIAMAATLTGIRHTVTSLIERTGPKTLFVVRFFREGVEIDGEDRDPMSFWERFPRLTVEEANRLRKLPSVE